jgi:hypothetical protein
MTTKNKHFGGPTSLIRLTGLERDTILAALRLWQRHIEPQGGVAEVLCDNRELIQIATNGGQHEKLTAKQIDQLCEDLNQ